MLSEQINESITYVALCTFCNLISGKIVKIGKLMTKLWVLITFQAALNA